MKFRKNGSVHEAQRTEEKSEILLQGEDSEQGLLCKRLEDPSRLGEVSKSHWAHFSRLVITSWVRGERRRT